MFVLLSDIRRMFFYKKQGIPCGGWCVYRNSFCWDLTCRIIE